MEPNSRLNKQNHEKTSPEKNAELMEALINEVNGKTSELLLGEDALVRSQEGHAVQDIGSAASSYSSAEIVETVHQVCGKNGQLLENQTKPVLANPPVFTKKIKRPEKRERTETKIKSELGNKHLWRVLIFTASEEVQFTQFLEAQLKEALDSAIKRHLFEKKGTIQLEGIDRSNGKLIVKCVDENSCRWLESEVPKLGTPGRFMCKKLEECLIECVSWIPFKNVTRDEIIALLQAQNPSLNTKNWRLFSLSIESSGQMLTLGVDKEGLTALEKINYKPYLLHGRVEFKIAKGQDVLEEEVKP